MPVQPTISIVRRCSKCGEPSDMRVVIASGDKPDFDEVLYECPSCGYTETVYVWRQE